MIGVFLVNILGCWLIPSVNIHSQASLDFFFVASSIFLCALAIDSLMFAGTLCLSRFLYVLL